MDLISMQVSQGGVSNANSFKKTVLATLLIALANATVLRIIFKSKVNRMKLVG